MIEFFEAVLKHDFMQNALIAGILAGIAGGIVGTYVVTRKITYISGGIAHAVLGGMGAAYYLSVVKHWDFLHPLYGAIVAALLVAGVIGYVSLKAGQREDTVISALWAVGMAVGIILISRTPGYNADLMSYLFGNILMVSSYELWLLLLLDIIVAGFGLLFYNQFSAICFDSEFARVRGINVNFFYLLLLSLIALTVVLLVTVVGIVMVVALLTIPVAIAGFFTRRLGSMMFLSAALSIFFTITGLILSYGPNLPAGATIIVLSGVVYLSIALFKTNGKS